MSEQANKPVKEIKARGGIRAAIWPNQTERGTRYSVSFEKSYRDKDGNWRKTTSLFFDEIPRALVVLSEAYRVIALMEGEDDNS